MAFRVSHTIKNTDRLLKKFKRIETDSKQGQIKAVQDAIFLIHSIAVESIQDNSSGTPAIRYSNGRKRHVLVSAPGTPPNTDTGRLVQSIKFDFKKNGLIGRVGTNLKYGKALEFGYKKGKRVLAARPWLAPAVKEASKEIADIFKKAVRQALKGVIE